MSDELAELFRAELRTHVDTLLAGLDDVEAARAEMFRAAHSLRGAARIMSLAITEKLARALESTLAIKGGAARPLDDQVIEAVGASARLLAAALDVADADLPAWDRAQADAVDRLVGGLAGAATPAPAAPAPASGPGADRTLLDIFRVEAETHTAALGEGLLQMEIDPTDTAPVDGLMRAAHSMKGAARVLGLDALVQLTHAMEDSLVAARTGVLPLTEHDLDRLLRATDLLAAIARTPAEAIAAWVGDHAGALIELAGEIRDRAQRRPAHPSAVVTASIAAASTAVAAASAAGAEMPAPPAPPAVVEPPPPPPPKEGPSQASVSADDRVVRVSAAVIDRLMSLAGESLVESRRLEPLAEALRRQMTQQAQLGAMVDHLLQAVAGDAPREQVLELVQHLKGREVDTRRRLGERLVELDGHARRADDLGRRLYGEAIASRMRPLGDGVRGLPRLVRDLAKQLGKQVQLVITGEKVGVDRDILERLDAPLGHILRNAIDHGVEPPAERALAGKPAKGTITIEAYHRAGYLMVVVSDDGRGIDVETVRRRIVERALATPEAAAVMASGEVLEHLFLPGFSTRDEVTEISGRGVGLDVVHRTVHESGGMVRISARPGLGTTFHLQLPITRSVLRALVVEIVGEAYAYPLARIHRIVQLAHADVHALEGRPYFTLEGKSVGLVDAHKVLELGGLPPVSETLCVVVIGDRTQQIGVVVDRLLGESDLVVRRLDPRLGKVADISAAAVLADGRPALIVDVEDMLRSVANMLDVGPLARVARAGATQTARKKHILVVDDSITVRELERTLLANKGYQVTTAVDGVDAWHSVRTTRYDLVITDVDMPRMDGIQLVRSLKQDTTLRSIPVMIVSYRDREEDRLRGLDAGANHYLTKSNFHDDRLLASVIELIGEPDGG